MFGTLKYRMERLIYILVQEVLKQISVLEAKDELIFHGSQLTFVGTHQEEHRPWYTQTRSKVEADEHSYL